MLARVNAAIWWYIIIYAATWRIIVRLLNHARDVLRLREFREPVWLVDTENLLCNPDIYLSQHFDLRLISCGIYTMKQIQRKQLPVLRDYSRESSVAKLFNAL